MHLLLVYLITFLNCVGLAVSNGTRCGRKRPHPILKYYPSTCMEVTRKMAGTSVGITGLRADTQ
jgi:hypothetical protein